ncbi:hypothetical protein [Streptomyces sp. NPDC001404]|uniref:hypothetical protein n=1 Tax=Streptomyces sp. NPDC001404 TaxID=3364571 RepID=UPI0036B77986
MFSKLTGPSEPAEPSPPPLRWYTAVTVYRHPATNKTIRATDTLRARSVREATLLFLAKAEGGPPKLADKDLATWTVVRLDVSETGEHALEEQERRQRTSR